MSNFQEKSSFIWNLADKLRGPYKKNEYQKVILPFTVLKRFDSVLEHSKNDVLDAYEEFKNKLDNIEPILKSKSLNENGEELGFYNYSKYDFNTLLQDPENIEENINHYMDCFSDNVKDIFENFDMKKQIEKLSKNNLLYLIVKKFSETTVDLSPKSVSNHEMGTIFEELIRKFSETSNEEAGEHFTPRDVVKLMTELMFVEDEDIHKKGLIKKIYDPTCGTGGMLTSCKEFILTSNKNIDVVLYGQEINPEIYAICKADMLIKGEKAEFIKGPSSTLSNDLLKEDKFDYIIANPPYGTDWERDKSIVEAEVEQGFNGRFGAGVPNKNDGQLLFIEHMISKMKTTEKSRIAVITNGSPLFTGDAGSGSSNIRKWIFENDYLEALVALPNQLFFNTEIGTYIWILTNKKTDIRKGKVQLIDAREEYIKMRKSLGKKRHEISEQSVKNILTKYKSFENSDNVKILNNEDFGYTKVVVERPMQLNYQVTPERLENLYSYKKFKELSESKNKNIEDKIKEEELGVKKQETIKKALLTIGDKKYLNWDEFEDKVKNVLNSFDLKPSFIKKIIEKLSEHDEKADYVTDSKGNIKPNSNLRDIEKIPLKMDIDEYFKKEVLKYYPNAWMDRKKDKTGYAINFTQYFYVPPSIRPIYEIKEDIEKLSYEIQKLMKEL